ncbi:MAG: hypothetical protein AB7O24_19755 [Kofleriaceae bacterium]
MQRWFVAACALLIACGETPTTIELSVAYDEAWQLSNLRISSAMASTTIDPSHRVKLLVPDGWADDTVHIEMWGMRADDAWAYGDVIVTPVMADVVTASVTLERVPCGAWCELGAMMCVSDGVSICEQRDDSCNQWSEPVACGGDTPFCSLGTCLAECVDECAPGESRCAGPQGEQVCGSNDSDSCNDWLPVEPCGDGETCSNGSCRGECQDECLDGASSCFGGGLASCADLNGDGCTEWGPISPCPTGSCGNGACQETCIDECSDSVCMGLDNLMLHTCGQFDLDPCKDLSPGTSCVPADGCMEGGCSALTGCTSAPKICEDVPEPTCADSNTVRTFHGACTGGDCTYPATDTDCTGGNSCAGGVCVCTEQCVPEMVGTGDGPTDIVLDGSHVYWTNSGGMTGTVVRRAKNGSGMEQLIANEDHPTDLALENGALYWVDSIAMTGNVSRSLQGAPGGTVIADNQDAPRAIGFDSLYVYWGNGTKLTRRLKIGGNAQEFADQAEDVRGIVVDGNYVYWTNAGTTTGSGSCVARSLRSGGNIVEKFADGQAGAHGIASDSTHVYWTTATSVMRKAKVGGSIETIATNQAGAMGIALDGSYVYWAAAVDGKLMRAPKSGGTPEPIAEMQGGPHSVAVDATHVYWTNFDGDQVMRISRCGCGL